MLGTCISNTAYSLDGYTADPDTTDYKQIPVTDFIVINKEQDKILFRRNMFGCRRTEYYFAGKAIASAEEP